MGPPTGESLEESRNFDGLGTVSESIGGGNGCSLVSRAATRSIERPVVRIANINMNNNIKDSRNRIVRNSSFDSQNCGENEDTQPKVNYREEPVSSSLIRQSERSPTLMTGSKDSRKNRNLINFKLDKLRSIKRMKNDNSKLSSRVDLETVNTLIGGQSAER